MTNKQSFPYWKYSLPPVESMFKQLREQNIITYTNNLSIIVKRQYPQDYLMVDHISNHFTEKIRITCSFNNNKTPLEIYKEYKGQKIYKDLTTNLEKREFIYNKTKECNTFNVSFCYYILSSLLNNNDKKIKMLDPSMGWGDRLIASIAMNIDIYHGYDPNKKLHSSYKKINNMLNINNSKNYKFYPLPFEDSKLTENYYDIALTSPPYFDLEIYSSDDTQSNVKYSNFEDWINIFYKKYLEKMVYSVAINGYIAIYVENIKSNNNIYNLYNITQDIMKTFLTKYYKKIGLSIGNKIRYIHIWQKIN